MATFQTSLSETQARTSKLVFSKLDCWFWLVAEDKKMTGSGMATGAQLVKLPFGTPTSRYQCACSRVNPLLVQVPAAMHDERQQMMAQLSPWHMHRRWDRVLGFYWGRWGVIKQVENHVVKASVVILVTGSYWAFYLPPLHHFLLFQNLDNVTSVQVFSLFLVQLGQKF